MSEQKCISLKYSHEGQSKNKKILVFSKNFKSINPFFE